MLMKSPHCLRLVAALVLTMNAHAQTASAPLPAQKYKFTLNFEVETQYLLHLPQDYAATNGRRWPLMLFLHGAGERGSDVQSVGVHGPMNLVKQGTNFPFIIVAPQCPDNQRWHKELLLPFLDHIIKTLAVDTNRIYLTGLSMGGYGTWDLGTGHPEKFAAIAPICGGGSVLDVLLAGYGRPSNPVAALPVWAFHGAKDSVVPLEESERMIGAMKKAGAKEARLTVYPEADHNSWTETYDNPEFYRWLLSHALTDSTRVKK